MKQPIQKGELYTDCTNRIAKAEEVVPVCYNRRQKYWYYLTGRAPNWDVLGEYVSDPGDGSFSNASWKHCGCVKVVDSE